MCKATTYGSFSQLITILNPMYPVTYNFNAHPPTIVGL